MVFGIWEIVTIFVITPVHVSLRPRNLGRPATAHGLIYIKDVSQTTSITFSRGSLPKTSGPMCILFTCL